LERLYTSILPKREMSGKMIEGFRLNSMAFDVIHEQKDVQISRIGLNGILRRQNKRTVLRKLSDRMK
jgi:hypothetical protein